MKVLSTILILAFATFVQGAVIEEDVCEFGEWYGVVCKVDHKIVKKEIVVFSHSNMASLVVSISQSGPEFTVSAGIQNMKPDAEIIVFIDDQAGVQYLDQRLLVGFKRGKTTEIHFVDSANRQHKELFSLKGFSKAYRWLSH